MQKSGDGTISFLFFNIFSVEADDGMLPFSDFCMLLPDCLRNEETST